MSIYSIWQQFRTGTIIHKQKISVVADGSLIYSFCSPVVPKLQDKCVDEIMDFRGENVFCKSLICVWMSNLNQRAMTWTGTYISYWRNVMNVVVEILKVKLYPSDVWEQPYPFTSPQVAPEKLHNLSEKKKTWLKCIQCLCVWLPFMMWNSEGLCGRNNQAHILYGVNT